MNLSSKFWVSAHRPGEFLFSRAKRFDNPKTMMSSPALRIRTPGVSFVKYFDLSPLKLESVNTKDSPCLEDESNVGGGFSKCVDGFYRQNLGCAFPDSNIGNEVFLTCEIYIYFW